MKKSYKKYLMLVLIVATMILATVSISYAASSSLPATMECSTCGTIKPTYGTVHAPQCDSEGYTDIICSKCKKNLGTIDVVTKLGHELASYEYVKSEDGTYYKHIEKCTRALCNHKEVESYIVTEGDSVKAIPVKYCQVNFINNFVVSKYESNTFCSYAKLAAADEENAYVTETETIYVEYPAQATSIVPVSASEKPYRMADKYFGRYVFSGWLTAAQIDKVYTDSKPGSTFSLKHDTYAILKTSYETEANADKIALAEKDRAYHNALVSAATSNVPAVTAYTPAEYNLYAIFKVDTAVKHTVKYYNYDGTLLFTTEVNHASETAIYEGETPERADNAEFTFDFKYWVVDGSNTQIGTKYEIPAVYGDVKVIAHYRENVRHYDLKYFYLDGTPILNNEDTVSLAGFTSTEYDIPDVGQYIASEGLVKPYFDEQYVYEPTGKWLIPSRGNYVVDLDKLTLPTGILDNTQIDYIVLVPQYQKYPRMFKLPVDIVYADDDNYHPAEISIQVTDDSGKVIGFATVDKSDKYYKDNTYRITFDVPYSSYYKVVCTSTGYKGYGGTDFHTMDQNDPSDDGPGQVLVTMVVPEGEPCGCICHTFFKPVWVGILNLLNSLFKLEYVCCEDMYASIGSELNYGP